MIVYAIVCVSRNDPFSEVQTNKSEFEAFLWRYVRIVDLVVKLTALSGIPVAAGTHGSRRSFSVTAIGRYLA